MRFTNMILSMVMVMNVPLSSGILFNNSSIGDSDMNVALNKNGVASTIQDSGTPPSEAFDGITSESGNRWASSAGKDSSAIDTSWIYVDLGSIQEVNKFILNWESRPNKFKMQVSSDLDEWEDVTDTIDNGFFKDPDATYPTNAARNEIVLDQPVKARYVKMQGIQRRREKNNDNNTGYSLYEFEVYGPSWSDETYVDEYLKTLDVPKNVNKNFVLPIQHEEYGIQIRWQSDQDVIRIDELGNATIKRSDQDQLVTLTAIASRGNITKEKTFEVVVKQEVDSEYEIFPVPQNITYDQGTLELSDEINVVFEDSVSDITKDNYRDVFKKYNISYQETSDDVTDKTNVIVGIKDGEGMVDEYYDTIDYNKEISTDKEEGYVLQVDQEQQTIAVLGSDDLGVKYGSYTIDSLFEQGGTSLSEVCIEDAPDTKFRGFIEGFYGSWTHENRKSLITYGGQYKMNTYIYGPKNDEYHYGKWREMYPEDKLNELKELVDLGKETGVEFVWAAHVGGHTDLSDTDINALTKKFDQLYDIGVRQFAIFFDDAATNNTRLVEYMNKIQTEYVDAKGDVKPLIFCPQYYNKKNGNEAYLKNVSKFDKRIQVMWTGDFVVSEINQSVIDYIVNLIDRPVYIWWNWPVNDLGRSHLMHLGPSEALQNDIQDMSGLVSNPMNQAQASKVALYSIADYTWNTSAYDSDVSWRSALQHVITDDEAASKAFELFAQNCAAAPSSFSKTDESVYMKADLAALKEKFNNQEDFSKEAEVVKAHFEELKQSIETLRAYKGTNGLSNEIKPWMDAVYDIADAGSFVVDQLDEFQQINKEDGASITRAKNLISEGKSKLTKSNGHSGKKAAQKVLYPFVEDLLDLMEERLYLTLDVHRAQQGFGSAKKDYTMAMDGSKTTSVELGSYIQGDYFGIDLGQVRDINDIEVIMQEKKDTKFAYYKEGELEYSLDKKTWNSLGSYRSNIVRSDTPISARYIRYRATELHENIATGENMSSVILSEIYINEQSAATVFTNDENIQGLQLRKDENVVSLTNNDTIALGKGKYMRVAFDMCKNLTMIQMENVPLTTKISEDGIVWQDVDVNELCNMKARYIEFSNQSEESISLSKIDIRLAGKLALKAELKTNAGDVYGGNANQLVDGNENTTLWLKRGDNGNKELTRYIDLDLQGISALHDMEVVFSGDNKLYGRVDISTNKEDWETIYSFDKVGKDRQTIEFHNEKARYIRYWMSNGEWIQIKEMYVNKQMAENTSILVGDQPDLEHVVDGDIFTGMKLNNTSHTFDMTTTGHENPKELVVLKDDASTITLEIEVINPESLKKEWITLGSYQNALNRIDLSAYDVTNTRVSWSNDTTGEIYELYYDGKKAINKDVLHELIASARLHISNGALEGKDETFMKEFQDAIVAAENIYYSQNVSQLEVDQMQRYLTSLLDALQVDKTALGELLEACEDLDGDIYTTDSWNALQLVITDAKQVMESEAASASDVEEAIKTLENTKEMLLKRASTISIQTLRSACDELEAMRKEYSEVEFAEASKAIEKATLVLAKDEKNIGVKEVQESMMLLATAKGNLQHNVMLDALRVVCEQADQILASDELEDVRPGQIEALRQAREAAQELIDTNCSDQIKIQQAEKNLLKAMQELFKIVEKGDVKKLVDDAKALQKERYTEASWVPFMKALEDAEAMINNDDASIEEVQAIYDVLLTTIQQLELRVDKEALKQQLDIAHVMIEHKDQYIVSTIKGLQQVIKEAEALYQNEEASQADVSAMTEKLIQEMSKARLKADKKVLEEALRYAKGINFNNYTTTQVAGVKETYAKAQAIFENEEATQEEVNAIADQLQKEITALVEQKETEVKEIETETTKNVPTADQSNTAGMVGLMVVSGVALYQSKKRKK